jgi:hypothetical protein
MTTRTDNADNSEPRPLDDTELKAVSGGDKASDQQTMMQIMSNIIRSIQDAQKNIVNNIRG